MMQATPARMNHDALRINYDPIRAELRKVEADPAHPRYVVTSRGLGYKLQT